MDTKTLDSNSFDGNTIAVLNETEADTSRALDIFADTYVPGKHDYDRPEKPVGPDQPGSVEKTRIYFMDRDWWNADNAKTSFYYWNIAADTGEYAFPGVTARLLETIETNMDTVVNVYYADIDTTKYDGILFNRVSGDNVEGALASNTLNAQTADIKISEMGENNMVVLSHDEFVYNSNIKCDTILAVYEPGKWDYGQFATGPVVVEPLPETITVYFSNPSWSSIYCYAWNDAGASNAGWPGELMTKDSTTNIWSYEMSSNYTNLIFNNGLSGEQEQKTGDLVLMGYSIDKPYWNGSAWTPIPGSIPDSSETIRVYYNNPNGWATVNAYVWDTYSNPKASWPGESMLLDSDTGLYYYEFTDNYVNIIFNNGAGQQTADISLSGHSSDTPLWNGNAWVSLDAADQPVVPPVEENRTVYFDNKQNWTNVYAYVWSNTSGQKSTWPGEKIEKDVSTGYFKYTFESIYNYIIFNNGSGSQTQDLCLDGVTSENPLWNGSAWVGLDGTSPETPSTPSTESTALYLLPHNDWKSDGATFVAYIWNNTGSTWCGLEDTNADGIYEMTLPEGYTNIIFIRMNPSATEYNWTYVWNQTVDLTVPTNGDNLFTIENPWNSANEYKGTGSWSRL